MLSDKPLPSERPTGVGVAAFNIALALSKRGNHVRYVCRGAEEKTNRIDDHFTVQTIRRYSRDNLAASLSILKEGRWDIFHVHSSAAAPSLLAARVLGRPAVFHSHSDQPLHPISLTMIRNVEMSLSQRVITVSESTREELIRNHHLRPGKVAVAYNGVDTEEFRPFVPSASTLRKYGLEGHDKMVVSLGTVRREKGQLEMVECLPEILKAWPRLTYVNIGPPDEKGFQTRLLKRAKELEVSESVKLLHPVPREDLVAVINAADLCVHLSTLESFGLAVVEEMACAKTVIAFNVRALPEIIDHKVDGFLVEPARRSDLNGLILELLGDTELNNKIGDSARAKVTAKFTWDKTASQIQNIYEEILN